MESMREKQHQKNKSLKEGVTLLGLAAPIAIIFAVVALLFIVVETTQQQSRDVTRKIELTQLERALELHYDIYNSYTQPERKLDDTSTDCIDEEGKNAWCPDSDLAILLADEFITPLPVDPINEGIYRYTYEPWNKNQGEYSQAGKAYDLCATLEAGGTFCINKRI